jgi:hypothetical protein
MFGNVINKSRLQDLLERGALLITGFDPKRMRAIHYPLRPIRIYKRGSEDAQGNVDLEIKHDFSNKKSDCLLDKNEYVIVEVSEQISMNQEGIVGHFVTPSHFIERDLGLVAGRIESPYGRGGEAVRFGLKNLLDQPNRIQKDDTLAYVYFVDLLSLRNDDPYKLTVDELSLFRKWQNRMTRIADSGWPTDQVDD